MLSVEEKKSLSSVNTSGARRNEGACLSRFSWPASCFDLQEGKGFVCVWIHGDVCVYVHVFRRGGVWALPTIGTFSWTPFFFSPRATCAVVTTPNFTNEHQN